MRSKDVGLMEKIKEYVETYALNNGGETPSTREIGNRFEISHVSAYRYLRSMSDRGMIRYVNGKIHTDRLDKIEPRMTLSPAFSNAIPAGPADEVEGYVDEYVAIPSVFTGGKAGKHYILRVSGESMIDAGIDSGDVVIIREQKDAHEGDVVVALINNCSSTLKRLRKDKEGFYLWAENNTWNDEDRFYGRQFEVQGVAVNVVKSIG